MSPCPTPTTVTSRPPTCAPPSQRTIPLLGFSAGREAATDPKYATLLLAAADDLTGTLDRTAP